MSQKTCRWYHLARIKDCDHQESIILQSCVCVRQCFLYSNEFMQYWFNLHCATERNPIKPSEQNRIHLFCLVTSRMLLFPFMYFCHLLYFFPHLWSLKVNSVVVIRYVREWDHFVVETVEETMCQLTVNLIRKSWCCKDARFSLVTYLSWCYFLLLWVK